METQTKYTLSIVGFAITTMLTFLYYVNDTYENRHSKLDKFEKEIKARESNVMKQEILFETESKNFQKREKILKNKENMCNDNYRLNTLLNEYKQFSGISSDAEFSACYDDKALDNSKCTEAKEKRQKAFSILNQTCLYALKTNQADDNFKNFIYSEKVRLSDIHNRICENIAIVNWEK